MCYVNILAELWCKGRLNATNLINFSLASLKNDVFILCSPLSESLRILTGKAEFLKYRN